MNGMFDEITSILDNPAVRAYIDALRNPPFWKAGTCPMLDSAGTVYDWGSICRPGWGFTGAVVDESVEVGTKVVGQGILIGMDLVLTSARVIQGRDLADLKFYAPVALNGRPRVAKVVASAQPRDGVEYGDPANLETLVRMESSDIALLRLEYAPAGTEHPAAWVGIGSCPTRERVRYMVMHPEQRCPQMVVPGHPELHFPPNPSCDKSFADAVLFSFYRDSPEANYVTPVQFVDVAENGSVLVAWNNHHPGATSARVPGVSYSPAMDRGAPVIAVGSSGRPKILGVVSGSADVPGDMPGAGVYYRITRADTWAPWILVQVYKWLGDRFPAPEVPGPGGSAPLERYAGVVRRPGSIKAAVAVLAIGGGIGIYAAG